MPEQTSTTNGSAANGRVPMANTPEKLPAASLAEARQALAAPFPGACIGFLPNRLGATSQWAAVFPYVDVTAIQDRLDLVAGPERWTHQIATVDEATLACRLALYDVAHTEIGQGTNRWSQSANAFKRCARHFGIGRYLTQLPAVRLKLGTGIPVNGKGTPYITDELLDRLRAGYEQQVHGMRQRFGEILPHPGVGAGESEGETPVHPEVDPEPDTTAPVGWAVAATGNPFGELVRTVATAVNVEDAELANAILAAAGAQPRSDDQARALLERLLARIPEEVAHKTLRHLALMRQLNDVQPTRSVVGEFGSLESGAGGHIPVGVGLTDA